MYVNTYFSRINDNLILKKIKGKDCLYVQNYLLRLMC